MKRILLLCLVLAGCGIMPKSIPPIPMPKPAPMCDMTVAGKCREMSAGETAGAGVRGHGENIKDEK